MYETLNISSPDFQVPLALTVTALGLLFYIYRKSNADLPDGPMTFPILGNIPQIVAAGDLVKFLDKYRKIYGNVFTIEMGGVKRVVVSGYDNIHHLLVKNADFTSNRTTNTGTKRLIEIAHTRPGIVWAPFPHWKIVRSFALNVLRQEGMGKSAMEPKIIMELDLYINHFIEPHLGTPIDMSLSLTYATSNIISQMVAGERFDYEDTKFQSLNNALATAVKSNMKASITKNIPFAAYLPSKITGQGIERETTDIIVPSMTELVTLGRKNWEIGKQSNVVSEAYLQAQGHQEKGMESVYTDDNIKGVATQLYVAGTETTSTALRWALLYMLVYPDMQERARKEIRQSIGERQVSMKDRLSLPYTDAVLHEVLRCANIVPTGLPHTIEKELVIEGKKIPAGAELLLNLTSANTDPKVHLEPNKFKPERFLEADGPALKSKIMAFGIGRRACLGEPLARMEFFLFFVSFLQKFKVLPPPDQKPVLDATVSLVSAPKYNRMIFERC